MYSTIDLTNDLYNSTDSSIVVLQPQTNLTKQCYSEITESESMLFKDKKILIYELYKEKSIGEIFMSDIHKMQLTLAELVTPNSVFYSKSILRVSEYNLNNEDHNLFKLNFSPINDFTDILCIDGVVLLRLTVTLDCDPIIYINPIKTNYTPYNWFPCNFL